MRRRAITALFVLAIVFLILGVVSFTFGYFVLIGTFRLLYPGISVLIFLSGIAELFLFLYQRRTLRNSPKEAPPEETVEHWIQR